MKPLKVAVPIAKWLLRISAGVIVYDRFWKTIEKTDVENISFYIALVMCVCVFFLLLGGILRKNTITLISGFVIFSASLALMFLGGFTIGKLLENFVLSAIGFYFVARGNRG